MREPLEDGTGGQVLGAVHVVRLVHPAPGFLRGHLQQVGPEGLGLGVRLGGVDVDAEGGVPRLALVHQGAQVGEAAGLAVVMAGVVALGRVVPLGLVALEQDLLAEPVGGQGDPLDVVEGSQERVGRLGDDVERNVRDDVVRHIGGPDDRREDVPGGDGAVLPVDGAVGIGVGGEPDLDGGVVVGADPGPVVMGRHRTRAVGPLGGGDGGHRRTGDILDGVDEACGRATTVRHGVVADGVGLEACCQGGAVGRDHPRAAGSGARHVDDFVTGGVAAHRDSGGEDPGLRVGAGEAHEVETGDGDAMHELAGVDDVGELVREGVLGD